MVFIAVKDFHHEMSSKVPSNAIAVATCSFPLRLTQRIRLAVSCEAVSA